MIRRVAVVFSCLVTGVLLFAASASAAIGDVQTPTVSGPIANTATSHPFGGTDIDLAKYGYVEQEFYLEGNAHTYDTSVPLTTATENPGLHPYRTRITVRRPISPADFNGTAVVEWNNVTAQFDLEANWDGDPYYLLKHGYVFVGVSAQRVGVNFLKGWDPARYSTLDVTDGGTVNNDGLSYEIFSAAIKALRGQGGGVDPLGGLQPQRVIASGESQSGSRLGTYYNAIQPLHEVIDAFLLTVSTTPLRTDLPAKVIRVLSENENKNTQAETDTPTLRHWEVAGASHLPYLAYQNFQGPVERDLGIPLAADCTKNPLSRVEWPYVVNQAIADLTSWSGGGPAPPIAPRGTYSAPNTLDRDFYGIAQGGIRLPGVTTPVGTNTGLNTAQPGSANPFSAFCGLLGSYEVFPQATLDGLYDDFGDYIDKVRVQAQAVSDQGFVLPEDVPRLVEQAELFPQIRPTAPKRVAGRPRSRSGVLKLTWFGTSAPATTFKLQHARAAKNLKWSTARGAGALTDQSFTFSPKNRERDGNWRYRVLSTTDVPATPIAAAYTVTTPYSARGGAILVDRTRPRLVIRCPKRVLQGRRAYARVRAADRGSGLRYHPKAKIKIRTGNPGVQAIRRRVADKVGNRRAAVCRTRVIRRR